MELSELSTEKRKDVIIDISKIMSDKYNISDKSINNFWNILILGVNYLRKHQNVDIDIMYR